MCSLSDLQPAYVKYVQLQLCVLKLSEPAWTFIRATVAHLWHHRLVFAAHMHQLALGTHDPVTGWQVVLSWATFSTNHFIKIQYHPTRAGVITTWPSSKWLKSFFLLLQELTVRLLPNISHLMADVVHFSCQWFYGSSVSHWESWGCPLRVLKSSPMHIGAQPVAPWASAL